MITRASRTGITRIKAEAVRKQWALKKLTSNESRRDAIESWSSSTNDEPLTNDKPHKPLTREQAGDQRPAKQARPASRSATSRCRAQAAPTGSSISSVNKFGRRGQGRDASSTIRTARRVHRADQLRRRRAQALHHRAAGIEGRARRSLSPRARRHPDGQCACRSSNIPLGTIRSTISRSRSRARADRWRVRAGNYARSWSAKEAWLVAQMQVAARARSGASPVDCMATVGAGRQCRATRTSSVGKAGRHALERASAARCAAWP